MYVVVAKSSSRAKIDLEVKAGPKSGPREPGIVEPKLLVAHYLLQWLY